MLFKEMQNRSCAEEAQTTCLAALVTRSCFICFFFFFPLRRS